MRPTYATYKKCALHMQYTAFYAKRGEAFDCT